MDTCGFFWSKNLFGQKTPKVSQRRRASQYVVHPKHNGPNLSIDVHTQPQKNYVPPTPTATGTKRQMREIFNNSNHHFHQNDFIFVETSKAANTKRSTTREETHPYETQRDHEQILKQRTRIINPRLPVIRDERPETSSKRRQRHRNNSQDHEAQGRVRVPIRPDLTLWYDSIDTRENRNEPEEYAPAKAKYSFENDKKTSSDNRKTKDTDKRSKETVVEHLETNGTQETYRTLTSVYRSKPSLMESFDDLLINRNGDPDKVIREVVENHVEKAYRRIDLIKRNFYKNKKKYLFHIASDF